jgi:transposase-like protein
MTIRPELIDELLEECPNPEELLREGGLLKQLTKALVERCLGAELDTHLEDAKRIDLLKNDRRNGHSRKTLKGEFGQVAVGVPRDRDGDFQPQLVKKRQTRLEGFDEKILGLYARGMTVRDIQAQLQELYGVEVSPTLISNVTDAVMEEVKQWQARPIDLIYPIVWFDALVVKVRENSRVINKAIHLALGVNLSGQKELLGVWMAQTEGAKFWLGVLSELQNRGLKDIFIACIDGLSRLAEAVETAYPQTQVQLCMVHLMRNSLRMSPTSIARKSQQN